VGCLSRRTPGGHSITGVPEARLSLTPEDLTPRVKKRISRQDAKKRNSRQDAKT
jgi:hypothetical protein